MKIRPVGAKSLQDDEANTSFFAILQTHLTML